MFSSRLTSVTFLADPSAGGGLPRGTFIYATSPIPIQVRVSQTIILIFVIEIQTDGHSFVYVHTGTFLLLGDRNRLLWRL